MIAERVGKLPAKAATVGIFGGLTVAMIVAIVATEYLTENHLVERFGSNVATELLGIIVTLAFVQRQFERRERTQKMRAAVGALRRGRIALADLIDVWRDTIKGSLDPRGTESPRTVQQLFAPYNVEKLCRLDPALPSAEAGSWLALVSDRIERSRNLIETIIQSYGATLDADYLEALSEVADDPFGSLVVELAEVEGLSAREWRVRVNRSRGHLTAHFVRLDHALRVHNQLAAEAGRFRSRHLTPSAQSMTLQLGRDHDLAIPVDIPSGWWDEEPAIGSLRAAM